MRREIKVIYKMIEVPEEERDAKLIEAFKILIEASNKVKTRPV